MRSLLAAFLLCAALLPSTAVAQTVTIGNNLEGESTLSLCGGAECTVSQLSQAGATLTAPVDGTVTSWSYRSGDEGALYQLEVLHPEGGGFTVSGRSPQVSVPDSSDTAKTVNLTGGLPIKVGDSIALRTSKGSGQGGAPLFISSSPGDIVNVFEPDGVSTPTYTSSSQQLLLRATITTAGGGGGGGGGTTPTSTTPAPEPPKPPVPAIAQTSLAGQPGQGLVLSAASTAIPAGESATSYTFQLGAGSQPITCPGQDPVLSAVVANNVTAAASVTVTTSAGTSASATTTITNTLGALPKAKVTGAFGSPISARRALASQALGQVQELASQCLPSVNAPSSGHKKAQPLGSVTLGESAPIIEALTLAQCASTVKIGIVEGVGCFNKVSPGNPMPAAEEEIICKHYRLGCTVKQRLGEAPLLAALIAGQASRAHSAITSNEDLNIDVDAVYWSTQPVRIDGVEIDPVDKGAIVLARAGAVQSGFLKHDSAYLISSDAVVKIAGIPVSLHVPNYASAYEQAKGAAECGQKVGEGVSEGHIGATNCLGKLRTPTLPEVEHLIPSTDGPIDLSVSPENLGVELGEFTIPGGASPIPVIPELPLTGTVKVSLTSFDAATVAVHLQLPVLSDAAGHGLTGDTTLELNNKRGLQLNYLHVKVPSLAQLGLSRLKNLEFTFSRPTSLFEGKGTLDLNDLINGDVTLGMAFEHGSFQRAHADYTAPPGGGYPLFGPVFLTYVGADVSLNPTTISGQANLAIGPAAVAGCGAMGVQGTIKLAFGNPFTIDTTGNVQVLCANFGYSSRFHADSDGHVGFGLGLNYPIPGLGGISGELYGQAYANFNENVFEAQIDGQVQANFAVKKCESIGPIEECTPTVSFSQSAGATISIGDKNGKAVGGAGVCTHFNFPILGGFDVGAGTSDLPGAILGASTYNVAAVAQRFQILLSNCSLSPFRLLPPPAGISRVHGHAAQAGDYTVHVTPGAGTEVIGIQGSGGAPQLTATGPGGQKVLASAEGISVSKYGLSVRQPSTGQTLIEIPHATPGSWTLTPAPGSAPLKTVAIARQLPEPKIVARVGGRGAKRTLAYSFKPQPGLTVKFAEGVDGGASPIGAARGAHGHIRFTPSLGSSKTRTIVAEIFRNGQLLASKVIARFAPGAIGPGRPSHILIRHTHGGWRISFRPGANTTEHQVTIHFADGAQALLDAPKGRHALTVSAAIDKTRPTAVEVIGLRGATHGRAAIVTARLARRKHR